MDCLELNDGGSVDLLEVGSLCRGIWAGWINGQGQLCEGQQAEELGVSKHWNKLSREVVESQSLEEFRRLVNGALGTWFSDGLGGAGLTVGLDDLKGLLQPK